VHACSFQPSQWLGTILVAAGACIVAGGNVIVGAKLDLTYVIVYIGAMLLMAYGSILKEKLFIAGKHATGKPLDIFVVNVGGSISQVHVPLYHHLRTCYK
jgi:hypothetical protein